MHLGGWAHVAFALLMDGVNVTAAHVLQDAITIALARYDDGTPAGVPAPAPPLLATVTGATGPTDPRGPRGRPARPARPGRRRPVEAARPGGAGAGGSAPPASATGGTTG